MADNLKTEYKEIQIYDENGEKRVFIDPENERKTWHDIDLEKLILSIEKKGMFQPILVEEIKKNGGKVYNVLGGNRRFVACIALNKKEIFARIYRNLTEKQRREIQRAENSTKVKIPLHERADNLWEYWKYKVIQKSEGRITKADLDKGTYDTLPSRITDILPQDEFRKDLSLSRNAVNRAFKYQNLHPKLKEEVEKGLTRKGGLSYHHGVYLGRIIDRKEQLRFIKNLTHGGRRPSLETMQKAAERYLKEQKSKDKEFRLENKEDSLSHLMGLYRKIDKATKFVRTFLEIAYIDRKILKLSGVFKGDKTTKEIIAQHDKKINSLEEKIREESDYLAQIENQKPRLSLKERILIGEFHKKGGEGKFLYKEVREVPIEQIVEDKSQPRKTFEKEKLEEISSTYSLVGLLEPILLKEIGKNKYRLVFGHRRFRAAKLINQKTKKPYLEKIDAMITDVPDDICRELQYEEDIYERIVLDDRARSLCRLYELKLKEEKLEEKDYTLYRFAHEFKGLGATTVYTAINFHRLDDTTKSLHRAGLLGFNAAAELFDIKDLDERLEVAIKAALFNYSMTAVTKEIRKKEEDKRYIKTIGEEVSGKEGLRRMLVNALDRHFGSVAEPEKEAGFQKADYKDRELIEKYHDFFKAYRKFKGMMKIKK